MSPKKTVVISDLHIGTNVSTNWYQKDLHEPYLAHILNWVIEKKSEVDELIILGDLFDFWTYAPNVIPPTADDIVAANPNILGPNGLFSDVLSALYGKVSYMRGNHDINTTQDDLNKIGNGGSDIKLQKDIYVKNGVVYTHGHLSTMFNAPDLKGRPIPFGHFITRAVSYYLDHNGINASETTNFGVPSTVSSGLKLVLEKLEVMMRLPVLAIPALHHFGITTEFLDTIQKATGIPVDDPILIRTDSPTFTTFAQVRKDYENLWTEWVTRYAADEGLLRGIMFAYKSAWADYDGSYLGWFAQQLAFEHDADLVVMGHTHTPRSGLEGGIVNYINSGFQCVPSPDMGKDQMTFSIITTEDDKPPGSKILAVQKSKEYELNPPNHSKIPPPPNKGKEYELEELTDLPPARIKYGNAEDYSCYITVENQSDKTYKLIPGPDKTVNKYGYFAVVPPQEIPAKSTVRFWIEDAPGLEGSEGKATYYNDNNHVIIFTFACTYGNIPFNRNGCGGTLEFYSKSGCVQNKWNTGHTEVGHPLFVKFIIQKDESKLRIQNWKPESYLALAWHQAGFDYDPSQDIIYSRMDALQRKVGYAYSFDKYAHWTDFIIDCEPIFFSCDNKIWMIELWKGQYGLETGCEIGVYNRTIESINNKSLVYKFLDDVLGDRGSTNPNENLFFDCAQDVDMPTMSFKLQRKGEFFFERRLQTHWWLTGFKWGVYSEPEDLSMDITIRFDKEEMQDAFLKALKDMGYNKAYADEYGVNFTFSTPKTHQPRFDINKNELKIVKDAAAASVYVYTIFNFPDNDPNKIPLTASELFFNKSLLRLPSFFHKYHEKQNTYESIEIILALNKIELKDYHCAVEFDNQSKDYDLVRVTKHSIQWSGQDDKYIHTELLIHSFEQNPENYATAPSNRINAKSKDYVLVRDNGNSASYGSVYYDIYYKGKKQAGFLFTFQCTSVGKRFEIRQDGSGKTPKINVGIRIDNNSRDNYVVEGGVFKYQRKGHPLHVLLIISQ